MSPLALPPHHHYLGFPRTRGDEPVTVHALTPTAEFSPHARG